MSEVLLSNEPVVETVAPVESNVQPEIVIKDSTGLMQEPVAQMDKPAEEVDIKKQYEDLKYLLDKKMTELSPDEIRQIEKIKGKQYIIDEYDGNESVTVPSDIKWIIVK
jgi:hypothetical protein